MRATPAAAPLIYSPLRDDGAGRPSCLPEYLIYRALQPEEPPQRPELTSVQLWGTPFLEGSNSVMCEANQLNS
ncbi:hypothetical protein SKAU_G00252450 [Synaphobranchus kaupii]|uniref:Uncharacterized protein n=1 Tax=Synaphobranchus kaupii TaxID=118154 RepID=A0A9Q1F345_SYNKA|nr:hypothetical protein SKAU_G00252450 [Synaphobranchus kaupii]